MMQCKECTDTINSLAASEQVASQQVTLMQQHMTECKPCWTVALFAVTFDFRDHIYE